MTNETVVIVDGYSTGKLLAPYLSKNNIRTIHVQSMETIFDIFVPSYNESSYDHVLPYSSNFDKFVADIKKFDPIAIIAGAESGVSLADSLARSLNLPCNKKDNKAERELKGAMIDALSCNDIRVPKQRKIRNEAQLLDWIGGLYPLDWPVVLKPQDSVASDGLSICDSKEVCITSIRSLLNSKNILGKKNSEVIAQSYLFGAQYIVNTISWDGHHSISDVWYTNRTRFDNTKQILEDRILLPPDIKPVPEVIEYAISCLDALGITHGASHIEIMQTSKGPVMIEVNGRPMGGAMPVDLFKACLGTNHSYLTADVYLDMNNARERCLNGEIYKPSKYMAIVDMTFKEDGTISNQRGVEFSKNLSSYYGESNIPSVNEVVSKTADTIAGQGYLCLLHDNFEQLSHDLQLVRQLKSNGEFLGTYR